MLELFTTKKGGRICSHSLYESRTPPVRGRSAVEENGLEQVLEWTEEACVHKLVTQKAFCIAVVAVVAVVEMVL